MARMMSGAEIVLESLFDQGVEHIFGYPGGAVLPIYDELFKQNRLQHILVRHEQGAGHAAEGYARSTGKVGVLLVTSGPGATNAVTALADALLDSIPLVCITGQVATHLIGNDAFQECDTVGITRPCTKHNYLVRDVNDLARVLHEAFYVAKSGRPGPVVVDIPKDVQFAKGLYTGPSKVVHKTYRPQLKGNAQAIRDAVELIAGAKRPVFYTGGGIINSGPAASSLLREFVRMTNIPIIGDCAHVLEEMIRLWKASAKQTDKAAMKKWWASIEQWRGRNSLSYKPRRDVIMPQYAIQRLFELTSGRDTYITTEVGQHQMWAAQFYRFNDPNRWMTSGGLGTMGYGLPAAVGVQVAHPRSLVIDIAGEASVLMTMQEMSTAVQHGLPIKIFILNNEYMGMVRQWQELLHGGRYSHSYSHSLPDFVKLAEAYRCVGIRAEKPEELDDAIREMIDTPKPVIFDCRVHKLANCFPMIPSGEPHNKMLLADDFADDDIDYTVSEEGKMMV